MRTQPAPNPAGGGFRDLLSELGNELCPSLSSTPPATPLFVPSPNMRSGADGDSFYILNTSCTAFRHLEWLGRLMGQALRSEESITLSLPGLYWRRLTGEPVAWARDYVEIDAAAVDLLARIVAAAEPDFHPETGVFAHLTFTTALSNGEVVELCAEGARRPVSFETRLEFVGAVQRARLGEADEQLRALQSGLGSSIPRAALSLVSWQDLRRSICGCPEIAAAEVLACLQYANMVQTDKTRQQLLAVLTLFSSRELSLFLRFASGRTRLPITITVAKGLGMDAFPTASTCASTIMLSSYSSAEVCARRGGHSRS